MTVAAPTASARGGRPLIETQPLRNPDSADTQFMGRRGWWLVAMNVLVPGSAQVLAGNRRLGRFGLAATLVGWLLVIIGVGMALFARGPLVWLTTGPLSWIVLTLVQVVLIGYAVLWVVLTIDTLRLVRLVKVPDISRWTIPIAAVLVLLLAGSGAVYASTVAASSRGAIGSIFGNSGPSLPPSDGYYNILLLGADSGDGRDSMRFDSISVVSVNAETGAVTITGIPRELSNMPFSEGPMRDMYPNGFEGKSSSTCGWNAWMNHVRNAAEVCREDGGKGLYPDAAAHGSDPGIEATKDAVEGTLGIEIPYYVFVDMDAFADLIDALGGVEITVTERVPEGPGPGKDKTRPVEDWATGWIEKGTQVMDGETAQWYARSRYGTAGGDYDRMKRQRELQVAILRQFTPQTVATRFNELAAAGTALVQTDLPQDKLPEFFDLVMKAKDQKVTEIELDPDNGVQDHDPDFEHIQELVRGALHPPTKEK